MEREQIRADAELFVFKPKAVVRGDARADGEPGEEAVEAPPVPAH
jgi:hypothetical protein